MTMQEIKDLFPVNWNGMASLSDLEVIMAKMGLDTSYIIELNTHSRPMLVASLLRQILLDQGAENLFPAEVSGAMVITELKGILVKFGDDYVPVDDEIV